MIIAVLLISLALLILAYEIDRLRQRVSKLEHQEEIHCNYTDGEIAQSFIEDVKMGVDKENTDEKD